MKKRLPALSSREVERALRKVFAPRRGKGGHRAYAKVDADGVRRLVIVPYGKDIPRGTVRSILGEAGLTDEEFLKYL